MNAPLSLPDGRTAAQARAAIDLSRPSYAAAYQFARAAAVEHAKARGADQPGPEDKAAGDAVFLRLLHHVPVEEGGFLGITDDGMEARCRRNGWPLEVALAALWDFGTWPSADQGRPIL